jgi:hypothetical protein
MNTYGIVIGHNNGWEQSTEVGKRNSQNFVQLPFSVRKYESVKQSKIAYIVVWTLHQKIKAGLLTVFWFLFKCVSK